MRTAPWKLPGYSIRTLIGTGASSEVWSARMNSTGAMVALKRITVPDPAQRRAAIGEAALLKSLDHPHLIRLYDLLHADDAIVLVLDLAGGGTLADLLAARHRLTPGEVITALAPIGAALAYAHSAGVVHGDVTPANLLFTDIGLPLLADLGVSRLVGDRAPARSTPAYIDPGVAAGGLPGPATDVFMLGAVALHALTGTPLWPGESAEETLRTAASGRLGDLARRLDTAGVPPEIATVVARALAIEPPARSSAADFALDLRHAGDPVAVELTAGRPRPAPAPGRPALPRHAAANPASGIPAGTRSPTPAGPSRAIPGLRRSDGPLPSDDHPALTYGVRAPSALVPVGSRLRHPHLAAVITAGERGLAHLGGVHRMARRAVVVGGAAILAAVVIVVLNRSGRNDPARAAAHVATASSATASALPASPRPPLLAVTSPAAPTRSSATAAAPPVARVGAATARTILSQLDAVRASAFAQRDPTLLARVYVPGALLARDTAKLLAIVPPGCGLTAARSSYTGVVVLARGPSTIEVRAQARLARSSLVCGGTVSGYAPAAGPDVLRIELVRERDGYRIAAQSLA